MMDLYSILKYPAIYKLSQVVLAPGSTQRLSNIIRELLSRIDPGTMILDVGCGPTSLLSDFGFEVVGSDLSEQYMRQYLERNHCPAVVNLADALPFASACFDSVWSFGLIHHLPDSAASGTLREMSRVCKPGGYVVVLDAVMPTSAWRKPLPYLLRKLDRGRFVREETVLQQLFSRSLPAPETRRVKISDNGLEGIWCWSRVAGHPAPRIDVK